MSFRDKRDKRDIPGTSPGTQAGVPSPCEGHPLSTGGHRRRPPPGRSAGAPGPRRPLCGWVQPQGDGGGL